MPIKTGDTFIADNSDNYVIDASGAESNPIRGIYHSSEPWTEFQSGGINYPVYLEDGAVSVPHMSKEMLISVPKAAGNPAAQRTWYQSTKIPSSSPDNPGGSTVGGVSVSDMTYDWQLRKNFHEFCMQFDKYPQIDQNHYSQYPEEYLICVWRKDKLEFQTIQASDILSAIITDGYNELIDNGVFDYFNFNPDNEDYWPGNANPTDLNGDGSTSTADLLQFLLQFGAVNDPDSTPIASNEKSIIRITYPDSDVDNPPFQVTKYVSGEVDGSSNLIPSSELSLGSWVPDNPNVSYIYEPGHPLTIPVSAFTVIPQVGDLTIDTTDSFGIEGLAILRPSTSNYANLTDQQYQNLDSFEISGIHKSGLYSNFNKFVILKARITVNTTLADVLHMHSFASYTRGIYQFFQKSCTRGAGGVSDVGGPFGVSLVSDPVLIDGSDAPQNHRSWVVYPQQGGTTQWVSIVIGLPNIEFLNNQQYLDWNYVSVAPSVTPAAGESYISPNGLLRMLSGTQDTEDVKMSFGFFSEYGFIEDVKVHELKIVLAPSIAGLVYED